MTSLSEAYQGAERSGVGLRRLYLGTGLFVVGALLVVSAIVVTTTDVLTSGAYTATALKLWEARRIGGVLGGLGVPAVFLGVFTVLPSSRQTRAAAIIGASIAIMGVGLFWHAYPCQWVGANCGLGLTDLTLPTVGVYFFGSITTFWCLFVGVANFKTRNDPGGTVKMEVTRKGQTKVVEVDRSALQGGVGLFGGTPDVDATDAAVTSDGGASTTTITSPMDDGAEVTHASSRPNGTQTAQTQAQTQTQTKATPTQTNQAAPATDDAEVIEERSVGEAGDTYCGNCAHFEYVRTTDGIQPYCGHHDDLMDDMSACEEWTTR